jgi:hypothetical protein
MKSKERERLVADLLAEIPDADDDTINRVASLIQSSRRPKSRLEDKDDPLLMEMARLAQGYADPLWTVGENGSLWWTARDDMITERKIPPCTVARELADTGYAEGNSRPAIVERLRKKFRENEQEYLHRAAMLSMIVYWAKISESRRFSASERTRIEQSFSDHIEKSPETLHYIRVYVLPLIRARRKELRSELAELDAKRKELLPLQRSEELARGWHSFQSLPSARFPGKADSSQAAECHAGRDYISLQRYP